LPFDSQPAQIFDHRIDEFTAAALWIEVLISKNESAPALMGALRGHSKCVRMPEVQQTGWGRCQTSAIFTLGKNFVHGW
jgi:hypothetical protein